MFQFYIKTETQCDDATKFENKIIAFLLQNIISMKSVSLSRGLNLQHDIFNVRDTTNKYCHQPGQNCFFFEWFKNLILYLQILFSLSLQMLVTLLFSHNYSCISNTYHKYDITHLLIEGQVTVPSCSLWVPWVILSSHEPRNNGRFLKVLSESQWVLVSLGESWWVLVGFKESKGV